MSLAQREQSAAPNQPGPDCGVRKALALLDQTEADALHRLIFERLDLSAAAVATLIREEDVERAEQDLPAIAISETTVGRHRRKQCVVCRKR